MKILLAEDSPTQATLMRLALQRLGHEVVIARDGIDAIKKAWQECPDLVVSDVMMPRLNGYQVCRLLRDDQTTARIPVILLTSLDQRQDSFWGLKSGADKFITKGGDIPGLVAQIHGFLEGRRGEGDAAPAVAEACKVDLDADVMERVVHLLDKNLFETTVVAEIQDLVRRSDDLRSTAFGVLEILGKVIDFHAGAIHLGGEEEHGVYVIVNKPVGEAFVARLCDRLFQETPGTDPELAGEPEIRDERQLLAQPGQHPASFGSALVAKLTTKSGAGGSVAIAAADADAYPERVVRTFEMIARQANIVLAYARLYETTKRLSVTDGLTKLFNHRYFQDALKRELSRRQRHPSPLSLALLDIDHFKRFNDTYGHQQGDKVLYELGRILKAHVRTQDIVARYGGEEFAVIMPDAPPEAARRVAERLREEVENHPVDGPSGPLPVKVSIGVASVPCDGIEVPTELIAAADRALYRAKERGRNRVEQHQPQASGAVRDR